MKIIIEGECKDHSREEELILEFENIGPESLVTAKIRDEWIEVKVKDLRKAVKIFEAKKIET